MEIPESCGLFRESSNGNALASSTSPHHTLTLPFSAAIYIYSEIQVRRVLKVANASHILSPSLYTVVLEPCDLHTGMASCG